MPDHGAYMDRFARALVTPTDEPPLFQGPPGRIRAGLDIYRNNVFHSLTQAMGNAYPVVKALVGMDFFKGLVCDFVRLERPGHPVLACFGARFPEFLETFEPVRSLPYLADVARLERARLEAWHSADALPLAAAALAEIPPDDYAMLTFRLHPAARAVASPFPVLTIWEAHQQEGEVPEIDLSLGAEETVIARPDEEVTMWRVPPGTAALMRNLAAGGSLDAAFEAARSAHGEIDLGMALGLLLQAGAFSGFVTGEGKDNG